MAEACSYKNSRQYPDEQKRWSCNHNSQKGRPFCFFHDRNVDKNPVTFKQGIQEILADNELDKFRFDGFIFPARTSLFENIVFKKPVSFRECHFQEHFDMRKTIFEADAYFAGAKFPNGAVFEGTYFLGAADFSSAIFGSGIFHDVKFGSHADFSNAAFNGPANFATSSEGPKMFQGTASFVNANFKLGVGFHAFFEEEANFSSAIFGSTHEQRALLIKALKSSEPGLAEAAEYFEADSGFMCSFLKNVHFLGAVFKSDVRFGGTLLSKAKFQTARFASACVFDEINRGQPGPHIVFGGTKFANPETVEFVRMDLSKVIFSTTDVTKFEFIDVIWPRLSRSLGFGKKSLTLLSRQCCAEEKQLGRKPPQERAQSLPLIERLYTQLKQNFEDKRAYATASDFHYGEMEMRRRQLTRVWQYSSLIALYCLLSGYGERHVRALFFAFAFFSVFAVAFLVTGLSGTSAAFPGECSPRSEITEAFVYSFKVMTFQRPSNLTPATSFGQIAAAIESVLGPVQIALLTLALRRRFKR